MRSKQKARNKRDWQKKCNKNGVRCIEYACLTIYYVFWGDKTMGNNKTTSYAQTETIYTMQNENSQGGNSQNMQWLYGTISFSARSIHGSLSVFVSVCMCAWWAENWNNRSKMKLYIRIAHPYVSMALLLLFLMLLHICTYGRIIFIA